MNAFRPISQRRFALLIAALLLLCNALVTAHAFGEVDHAVKDGCQILHQFEREQHAPPVSLPPPPEAGHHLPPVESHGACRAVDFFSHFQPRAPPPFV